MSKIKFDPSSYTSEKAKPLPVILLLDVSASMNEVVEGDFVRSGRTVFKDGKEWEIVEGGTTRISILNKAIGKMLATLTKQEGMGHEFPISMISFGEEARLILEPTASAEIEWTDLKADGLTPLGSALTLAKGLVEDKSKIPGKAYRPTIVLVSDGKPTDEWEAVLADFVTTGRSSKCDRMAMGIGEGADPNMLEKFIVGTGHEVFSAENADDIHEFFKLVTMSVTSRMHTENPNIVPSDAELASGASVKSPSLSAEEENEEDDDGYF